MPGGRPRACGALDLTPRQERIVRLAVQGVSNAEIATQLGVRQGTVKSQFHNAAARTGCTGRRSLAWLAYALGVWDCGKHATARELCPALRRGEDAS